MKTELIKIGLIFAGWFLYSGILLKWDFRKKIHWRYLWAGLILSIICMITVSF